MGNNDNLACFNHFGISISCSVHAHPLHRGSPMEDFLTTATMTWLVIGQKVEDTSMKFDNMTLIFDKLSIKCKEFPIQICRRASECMFPMVRKQVGVYLGLGDKNC